MTAVHEKIILWSIPAGAGEPMTTMCCCFPLRVYPRGCGGTDDATLSAENAAGLSPRVRGNRVC